MDENLNNKQQEIWHNLLANPANAEDVDIAGLRELINTYPQSGLLRAYYGQAQGEKNSQLAGAYFDSAALYKLFYQAGSLLPVSNEQIAAQIDQHTTTQFMPSSAAAANNAVTEESSEPVSYQKDPAHDVLTDQPPGFPEVLNISLPNNRGEELVIDSQPDLLPDAYASVPEPTKGQDETQPADVTHEAHGDDQEELVQPDIISDEPVAVEEAMIEYHDEPAANIISEEPEALLPEFNPATDLPEGTIEDEVFDEITGIDDINIAKPVAPVSDEPVAAAEALLETNQEQATESQEVNPALADEAEKLMLGNIAATDYFVFDRAFGDKKSADTPAEVALPAAEVQPTQPEIEESAEHQDVSRYHDEKMPYTFMWWLEKTRKEHVNLYQPYTKSPVASPVSKPAANPLQQQYIENIFHITSMDELSNEAQTIEFDMQSKEDRIIQRFITEDPHIHPPVGEKLDTENKAKKSSEDDDHLVTETLARIYTEQMLYPKAITTYKKLMLKYPEKSRYFASRIENLEKKTN